MLFFTETMITVVKRQDGPVCVQGMVLESAGCSERESSRSGLQARNRNFGFSESDCANELVGRRTAACGGILGEQRISLVTVKHLPKTYLDGAELRGGDGRPVIGFTLRYDRIDNFWFCLLHELAHVGLHIDNNEGDAFFDGLGLGGVNSVLQDKMEKEADQWVEEALIPKAVWDTSEDSKQPTTTAVVINLARVLNIHPAVVAGRVCHERGNCRLLSQFVGTGEIRWQFALL